ncbi:MAG: hypothetical protein JWN75_271 [Candidatus Saccharibacteria bacterium]|nr:hypothetical protein [Candidatus Saccharibacteria bacterium]
MKFTKLLSLTFLLIVIFICIWYYFYVNSAKLMVPIDQQTPGIENFIVESA